MKQPFFKKLNAGLLISFAILGTALIIHSCKKDNSSTKPPTPVISEAKAWYESTYPLAATSPLAATPRGKLTTQALNSTFNSIFDYSQHIKPDWVHGASYTRYNTGVVEVPIAPSSPKINSDFKNMTTGQVHYKQQYSRSSFLLLNDGKSYQAYVMTIIADSAYINGDPSRLSLTTYRKRDPTFSGVVVYFTPTGKFVSSYGYKNGTLIAPPPSSSSAIALAKPRVRGINNVPGKIALNAVPECTDWYLDTYEDDVLVSSEYLYTTCTEGGGSGGESGGSSPSPTPCTPPASTPPPAEAIRFTSDVAQPSPTPIGGDGDGGLPPPPAPEPCPTTPVDTTTFKIVLCGGLTPTEITNLQSTISAFETLNCASKFLTAHFSGQAFSFCIDSTANGFNVSYSPQNNSFTFATDFVATPTFADLLEHEFFHAYQNFTYLGGTVVYAKTPGGANPPGFVNIEFEEAVFLDIATNSRQAFALGTGEQQSQYDAFIKGITANGTVYPQLTTGTAAYTTFINQYNSFLSQYNALPDNPNTSTIISLTPQAFITLFNSVTPNC